MTAIPFDENVSNIRFVAFDTETTGASPANDYLVEIAAIAFDEEFEHRRFQSLIKPPISIPANVIQIHGITDEMVSEPGIGNARETLPKFHEFLEWAGEPRVLLAHNARFDVGMIHGEASRIKEKLGWSNPELVLDTCMLAKTLVPEIERHSVESLMTYFKIEPVRYHRALEDVKALYQIFMKLLGIAADKYAGRSGLSLNQLIDLAGGYFVLNPSESATRRKPFRLPPRIATLESLCGTDCRVAIVYAEEKKRAARSAHTDDGFEHVIRIDQDAAIDSGGYRYITPVAIKLRAFKVYVEAFCHRDNIKKTFRADRILKIGKIESVAAELHLSGQTKTPNDGLGT